MLSVTKMQTIGLALVFLAAVLEIIALKTSGWAWTVDQKSRTRIRLYGLSAVATECYKDRIAHCHDYWPQGKNISAIPDQVKVTKSLVISSLCCFLAAICFIIAALFFQHMDRLSRFLSILMAIPIALTSVGAVTNMAALIVYSKYMYENIKGGSVHFSFFLVIFAMVSAVTGAVTVFLCRPETGADTEPQVTVVDPTYVTLVQAQQAPPPHYPYPYYPQYGPSPPNQGYPAQGYQPGYGYQPGSGYQAAPAHPGQIPPGSPQQQPANYPPQSPPPPPPPPQSPQQPQSQV